MNLDGLNLQFLSDWRLPTFDLTIDWRVLLAYALGVVILYVAVRLLFVPFKETLRLLVNSGVGVLFLLLFNLVGGGFGLHLPLNPVTALVVGLLGLPGVGLLVALQFVVL